MTDPQEQRLDPEKWPLDEVLIINSHAMLMGYLTMAIKGLGYLVLTWTTVVLLGGFVSMLHKKDFWCLTFITLVQTAGVFDAVMNEKLSYIGKAVIALLRDGYLDVLSERDPLGDTYSWLACLARFLLACILTLVQVLVLVVVLCPLAILYVLGIVMSGGISLWRLIQHDYSNSDTNGEAPNLAPALDTLYYLALLQGVLFCYRFILRRMRNRLANEVASKKYKSDCSDVEVVSNYLCETRRGCEKDQSFAKGRNLITVAVEKIGSNSLFECISGVRMLYTSINIAEKKLGCLIQDNVNYCLDSVSEQHIPMKQQDILRAQHKLKNQRNIVSGQRLLTNYLIVSASPSRHVLQKLLEMLDPRGVYNREIRNKAASILERLAFTINLEEFPRGIQHISSLIGTLQDYGIAQPYEREYDQYGWLTPSLAFCDDVIGEFEKGYKLPLLLGLLILERLAFDENNCRIMSNTRDLISKIMAPVTSDLLHRTTDDHGVWSDVVYSSMKVLAKLTRAPGETGAKLRREISSYEEAINTLWRILNCNECNEEKQLIAFIILGRLYYMDTESSISSHFIVPKNESSSYSKEVFIWKLVNIFTRDNMHSSSTRVYAGGVLSWICLRSGISDVATIVRHTSGGDVVDGLTKVLTQDEDESCRQVAAEILENLCAHYIEDDECPGKLKKVVTDLIPEVLGKIILSADKTHTGKEVDHDSLAKQKFDIENQCDGTRENNEWGKEGKEIQAGMRPVDSTYLLSSLLSLCATVYCTMFISDLPPLVDVSSFLTKLHGVVVEKSDPTEENLLLCKATCKMVISMMKYNGSGFSKQEELENFLEVLSRASKGMLNLDHSMVFRFIDGFEYIWVKLNRCTLASLVKEAEELHATMMSTSTSG